MNFRPCIDIHDGKVKQIVGSSLDDEAGSAAENFVSKRDADFFAEFYAKDDLTGGHVIMLNKKDSPFYEETKAQALKALKAFPGGLQIGGGINPNTAKEFLDAGASHVIITSYAFTDGRVDYDHLEAMRAAVGKEHLVLDLSCRNDDGDYIIVTDRWQKESHEKLTPELLDKLNEYADEFLVHAVDMEGKRIGVDIELVKLLGDWGKAPVTYAGGIASYDDIDDICEAGSDKVDFTIGSALDLFGGELNYETVLNIVNDLS